MGAAALPIMMGIGAGANVIGGALSGRTKMTKVPPPNPVFPGANKEYLDSLKSSGVTGTSFNTLNEAARTGLPSDVGPMFENLKASSERGIDEGRANLIEKYGVSGLRQSSSLYGAATDYEAQTQKDFASILSQYIFQASEAANNRRLQAATIGQGASGEAGLALTPSVAISQGSTAGGVLQGAGSAFMDYAKFKMLMEAGN